MIQRILKWFNDPTVNKNGKYIIAFDFLNIFACICVVALHVNGAFWNFSYERYWITSNLIESVCYWAVPIFFMLSGATLMDYRSRYSTADFMKKRLLKTVIPFLVWSVIGIFYKIFINKVQLFDDTNKVLKVIDIIFNTRAVSIYWFFFPLFAAYLSLPIISAISKNYRKKVYTYTIMVAIFTISILPLVCNLIGISLSFTLPVACEYTMYLLLGYCIANYPINKKLRIVIYIMGVIGLALHLFGTFFLSYRDGSINSTFKGYLNIPTVMYSIAVFVLFFYFRKYPENPKIIKLVRSISGMSFGVYLVHYYVINVITSLFDINTVTWQWRFFGIFVVYLVSLAITFIIKKIPILKNIVP